MIMALFVLVSQLFPSIHTFNQDMWTLNSCGFVLQDKALPHPDRKYRDRKNDLHEFILLRISKNKDYQPLVINRNTKRPTLSSRFVRSLSHECFICVEIIGRAEVSPIFYHWMWDMRDRSAIIVICLQKPFLSSHAGQDTRVVHHRMFFIHLRMVIQKSQIPNKGYFIQAWFFCPLCQIHFQSLKLNSEWNLIDYSGFQGNWVHQYHATHPRISLDRSCGKLVNWLVYSYILFKCSDEDIIMNSIAEASKLNFTFGPSEDPSYPIYIFREMSLKLFHITELDEYDYEETKERKCVYCICVEQYSSSQTNIWYFYVTLPVWLSVLGIILSLAFLQTLKDSKQNLTNLHKLMISLLNNIFSGVCVFLRQSERNWHLPLVLLDLCCIVVLSAYENFVTLQLILPSKPPGFNNFTELMVSNYTHLVFTGEADVIAVNEMFGNVSELKKVNMYRRDIIKELFWKRTDGKKYVLNDPSVESDTMINFINVVVGWKFPCFKLYPPESPFQSVRVYTVIRSCLSPHLIKGKRKLEEMGAYSLLAQGRKLNIKFGMFKLRQSMSLYDDDWKKFEDQGGKYQQNNYMITLQNGVVVIYVGVVLYTLANVVLVFEKHIPTCDDLGCKLITRKSLSAIIYMKFKVWNQIQWVSRKLANLVARKPKETYVKPFSFHTSGCRVVGMSSGRDKLNGHLMQIMNWLNQKRNLLLLKKT